MDAEHMDSKKRWPREEGKDGGRKRAMGEMRI